MTVEGFDANEELLDPIIGVRELPEYARGGNPMASVYIIHPEHMAENTFSCLLSARQLAAHIKKCQEVLQQLIHRRENMQ